MATWKLLEGDCRELIKGLPDNSIDAVVTDPPYELGFMGKGWDKQGIANDVGLWKEVLRVLKPGGHLLAFGGTRTYHRMASAIEDAGFEIRDQIQWLYGSGFPKSMDISKAIDKALGAEGEYGEPKTAAHAGWIARGRMRGDEGHEGYQRPWMQDTDAVDKNARRYLPATPEAQQWVGWGTALKPANEICCLARKPLSEKTVADNVLRWGTGGINVDGCRVGNGGDKQGNSKEYRETKGRFPANIILDEVAAAMMDEQSGVSRSVHRPSIRSANRKSTQGASNGGTTGGYNYGESPMPTYDDIGGASRFFYVAKASKKDRGEGNTHPTIKPTILMQYLCRLITPPNGVVLDPFAGSGSTLIAALREGFDVIGIELQPEYCEIARSRLVGE